MAALCGLSFCVSSTKLIITSLPLFVLGLIVYRHRYVGMKKIELFLLVVGVAVVSKLTLGSTQTVVGLSTVAALLWLKIRWRPLVFLGSISYSLYLIHVPIGGRIINLALRLPDTIGDRLLGLGFAVLASVTAAWILWKFVEVPAQTWSRRIAYRRAEERVVVGADVVSDTKRRAIGDEAS
jgi:peptidoglycan/LPS O-acetylase OafA/YrhL